MTFEPLEIIAKTGALFALARMVAMPSIRTEARASQIGLEHLALSRGSVREGADAAYRGLAGRHPGVQEGWMIDEEGRHAQTRRIAHAEPPPPLRLNRHRRMATQRPRHVLGEIEGKGANEPHREHFDMERRTHHLSAKQCRPVGSAELAGSIDCGRAHQIADLVDLLDRRLATVRKARHDVVPKADRAVRPRQRQFAVADPSGLLERDVLGKAIDVFRSGDAVEQCEGCVPGCGDDPVGSHLIGKIVGERHETVGAPRPDRSVDGVALAGFVNFPLGPLERPVFGFETTQERAHEGQSRLMRAPHPGQSHDGVGGAKPKSRIAFGNRLIDHHAKRLPVF
ncbi:hypothetical protein OH818_06300 [Jiella pelagia]|uniref:Uncharacterized protein n=1 Tax=Jiella pelagia TaxID=2986949 RepID=A0ABY7C4N3_9HYPH|nr:hypothetical protein OH818_06300 [Jiella pelagia]